MEMLTLRQLFIEVRGSPIDQFPEQCVENMTTRPGHFICIKRTGKLLLKGPLLFHGEEARDALCQDLRSSLHRSGQLLTSKAEAMMYEDVLPGIIAKGLEIL